MPGSVGGIVLPLHAMEKMSNNSRRSFGRENIADILGEYVESGRFREDFESLTPSRRIGLMERIMPFVVGRMKNFDPADIEREQEPDIDEILMALMAESEKSR